MVRVVRWCRRDEKMCVDGNVERVDGDSNKEQYGTVRYSSGVCRSTVQHSTVQYSTVRYVTVQYTTV